MDRKPLVQFARKRAPFDSWFGSRAALAWLVFSAGCDAPLGDAYVKKDGGGVRRDGATGEPADSGQVDDPTDEDAGDPGPSGDAAVEPGDGGADASVLNVPDARVSDASLGDGSSPPVISAPVEVMQALCSDAYDSVKLTYSTVTRGSWQFNPGGAFVKLTQPGYPCRVFLEDEKARPAVDDKRWSDASDGAFLGFSENSAITTMNYTDAQFRYFRSYIFVPTGANLKNLSVKARGIDDAVHLEVTNSRYPKGTSPRDVGPSDPDVGACQGNGDGEWNLAKYMVEGEINVLLLVHADMAAATSTLLSVDVRADGAAIQLVSCKK